MDVDLERELRRSEPDYVVYKPGSDGPPDTGNEHFLVFGGDGSLMAVWTQSSYRRRRPPHRLFRSEDEGVTAPPRRLVRPRRPGDGTSPAGVPAGLPIRAHYVLYNQYRGIIDVVDQFTGTMVVSTVTIWALMVRQDHPHAPEPATTRTPVPSNWIVWQMPIRDLQGAVPGFTRWLSKAVRRTPHAGGYPPSRSSSSRFENIDDDPQPRYPRHLPAWGDGAARAALL